MRSRDPLGSLDFASFQQTAWVTYSMLVSPAARADWQSLLSFWPFLCRNGENVIGLSVPKVKRREVHSACRATGHWNEISFLRQHHWCFTVKYSLGRLLQIAFSLEIKWGTEWRLSQTKKIHPKTTAVESDFLRRDDVGLNKQKNTDFRN